MSAYFTKSLNVLSVFLIISAVAFGQDESQFSDSKNHAETLSFNVPIRSYPGRGLSLPIALHYSSEELWKLKDRGTVKYYYDPQFPSLWANTKVFEAVFAEHSRTGWRTSLDIPKIEFPGGSIKRIWVHMTDGSKLELRKTDTPYTGSTDYTGDFYAVDGSRLRYNGVDADTGTLYMPDGTQWVLDAGDAEVIDRHGNTMNYDGSTQTWTDTLGREIVNPIPEIPTVGTTVYTLPGLDGVNGGELEYTFKWENLGDALTDGELAYVGSHYLPTPAATPNDSTNYPWEQDTDAEYLFNTAVAYNMMESDWSIIPKFVVGNQAGGEEFNPVVLTEIVLPDGTKYEFSYNSYGELDKIIYPNKGYEILAYDSPAIFEDWSGAAQPYVQTERKLTSRGVSANGTGSDLAEWSYSYSYDSGVSTVTAPSGTKTITVKEVDFTMTHRPYGYRDSRLGMVKERRVVDSSNALMRRELFEYEQTTNTFTHGLNTVNAHRNQRLTKQVSVIFEGSGSALAQVKTFTYDTTYTMSTGVDQTGTQTYHYTVVSHSDGETDPIGDFSAGSLAKTTETTFSSSSTYRNANILGLPTIVKIKNAAGTVVSQSTMSYDDSGYVPTSTTRGSPTTMKTWDSTKGSDPDNASYQLVTHAKFDDYGNRIEATDALGYVTTTTFDSTHHAYPISVTSPVPDSSGTYGSNSAFTSSTTYDFVTGLVLSTTDANGQVTEMEYEDPLLRPTKVTAPNGHQTITEYGAGTSEQTRWVKVKTQIDENFWSEAISKYDGLGRTYLTEKLDSNGSIFTETEYDDMGRVKRSANPYKTGDTKKWTTPTYDDLSRTEKVTSPDTSEVTISYGLSTSGTIGTTKTITDQAGKSRKGITDALGNMTQVIEDPSGTPLTTDYVFDVLGNLRKTTQGDQIRYFSYDSLGRVLRAKQVEQTVNSNLNLASADAVTSNNSWTVGYSYDDNSNIVTTTDAKNQTITATYDRLNRLTTRDYSDAGTPDVSFYYDGRGLDSVPAYSKGKTTKVTSSVSETRNTSFDIMGRLLTSEQRTDGETYPFEYTYNLSGALIEETYPSGRVVRNVLDENGDLETVRSKKNSNFGFFDYAKNFTYNSAGAVTKMQLGNGHWETASYDTNRLQVTQIGLGLTDSTTGILKLEFKYEGADPTSTVADRNNGSMREQKITVPTVGENEGFTAIQTYTYDVLNRLGSATETISSNQTWKQTFSYDRYGNRRFNTSGSNTTTIPSGCSEAICNPTVSTTTNRLTSSGYVFDDNGNLTVDATGKQFFYDQENHQKEVQDDEDNTLGEYLYDGEGKRVKKIVGAEVTVFVYDASAMLVAEYSTELATTPQVSYMTADHLGSPRIITNENGAVTDRKDYSAFGEATVTSERVSQLGYTSADETRKGFTGYEKDAESALEFAQARYYKAQHGRFTSVDPLPASANLRDPQSFNRFTYASNSPYKFVDPLGLAPHDVGILQTDNPWLARTIGNAFHTRRVEQARAETARRIASLRARTRWNYSTGTFASSGATTSNEDGGSVTASAVVQQTVAIVAWGEPGTTQNVGKNFWRAAMTAKHVAVEAGFIVLCFPNCNLESDVRSPDGFQGLLDMAAKYGVATIALFSHGSPSEILLGDGKPDITNTINDESLKRLVNRASKLTSISIYGCQAGAGSNSIAQKLANQLNVIVHASTTGMDFSPFHNRLSGNKIHPDTGPTFMVSVGNGRMEVFRPQK